MVGHNVSFDLGFLRAHGLLNGNVGLDTWELATIMLPSLPGYSLGALAERFGLALHNAHRARWTMRIATGWLFEPAVRRGRPPPARRADGDRPAGLRQRLAPGRGVRRGADGGGRRQGAAGRAAAGSACARQRAVCAVARGRAACAREHPEPVDAAELAAMLRPGGAFSAAFPGYEFRPPQVDMLEAVAGAFNQGHHLMVEAGTGTGKSVAYLLPAIAFAAKNNARVVVSTNTINLQDQLFRKDLPDLQRVLGKAGP